MTDTTDVDSSGESQRDALAAEFDRDRDPLAAYDARFKRLDVDPFEIFKTESLATRNIAPRTRTGFDRVFHQWKTFMAEIGRHPACPNPTHIQRFAKHELDVKENDPETVKEKLRKLRDAYTYWQDDPSFPHPQDYQPFDFAVATTAFGESETKPLPRLSLAELRERIDRITHIRNVAVVVLQLKLGLRASELCNLMLSEVALSDPELQGHYSQLGTDSRLADRENVVYVTHNREQNKSRRPRLLPLDPETQRVLTRYLFVRPDTGQPWVFLSLPRHNQLGRQAVNAIWKETFHPTYAETERHRAVTSHFGRHFFTTYWEVHRTLPRELVQYMRGDAPGAQSLEEYATIDQYIHTYFEDIVDRYHEDIFELDV